MTISCARLACARPHNRACQCAPSNGRVAIIGRLENGARETLDEADEVLNSRLREFARGWLGAVGAAGGSLHASPPDGLAVNANALRREKEGCYDVRKIVVFTSSHIFSRPLSCSLRKLSENPDGTSRFEANDSGDSVSPGGASEHASSQILQCVFSKRHLRGLKKRNRWRPRSYLCILTMSRAKSMTPNPHNSMSLFLTMSMANRCLQNSQIERFCLMTATDNRRVLSTSRFDSWVRMRRCVHRRFRVGDLPAQVIFLQRLHLRNVWEVVPANGMCSLKHTKMRIANLQFTDPNLQIWVDGCETLGTNASSRL